MPDDYSYAFTETARADLEDIDDYISFELFNPDAAASFLDEFESKIKEICKSPKSGRKIHNEFMKRDDVRRFLIKNYTAYYVIDDRNRMVVVLRVIYSGMDQDKITTNL